MWSLFKSVFTGQDHVAENLPCQDYADYTITVDGSYVAALSDGASSAAFSDIAASCNVNSVLNIFQRYKFSDIYKCNDNEIKKALLESCNSAISKNIHRIIGSSANDFAATLLFAASDGNRFIAGHLGDGIICSVSTDNIIRIISQPNNINNATDRTFFTVSDDALRQFNIIRINDIRDYSAFILMSDGPETSFYNYVTRQIRENNLLTISNDIARERNREMELTYFMKSNFWKYGITGDDCSMVIFTRESE